MKIISQLKKDQNKLLVLVDQAIISGGNFALGLVLIRTLGLTEYGLFAMLWMGVLLVLSLHQAFITKPMMTLAVDKTTKERQQYFKDLWWLQITFGIEGLSFLLAFMCSCYALEWLPNWLKYLPLMGGITIVYLLQDFIKKTFFINKSYHQPLIMDIVTYGILFIGLLYLILIDNNTLWSSLLVLFSGYLISTLLFCKPFFKNNKQANPTDWQVLIKKHYHFSNWLLGTSILQWFSGNFFLLTAASTLGTTAVGAVRIGQNIVGLCHVLFLAMENIVPAEAAQLFLQKGTPGLIDYLKNSTKKMGVLLLSLLLLMAIAAPSLIQLFYGVNFISYSYIVWGYCWLYIFVFFGYPARYFFRTTQFTKPIFIAYCVSAIFSVVVAIPMVQTWGIMGVLSGLIASQILTLLVYGYYMLGLVKEPQLSTASK